MQFIFIFCTFSLDNEIEKMLKTVIYIPKKCYNHETQLSNSTG